MIMPQQSNGSSHIVEVVPTKGGKLYSRCCCCCCCLIVVAYPSAAKNLNFLVCEDDPCDTCLLFRYYGSNTAATTYSLPSCYR